MVEAVTRDTDRGGLDPDESPDGPDTPGPDPGRVVLVVDDDAAVRRVVRAGLEREGFCVCDAADSTQALDELAACSPLLVILDINLGPMGGFDVLSRIRVDLARPGDPADGRRLAKPIASSDSSSAPTTTSSSRSRRASWRRGCAPCCGEPRRCPARISTSEN